MSTAADKPVRHILSISGGKDSSALTKLFTATGIVYVKGPDLLTDARAIIDAAQASAYRAVNVALVYRNWLLCRRIAEEDLGGKDRAEYGLRVVTSLAEQLTGIYGDGFDRRSLYMFLQFYRRFPNCGLTESTIWRVAFVDPLQEIAAGGKRRGVEMVHK